jgi:GT2 family glycosyltransferase
MSKKSYSVSVVIPNRNGKVLLEKNLPYVLRAAPHAEIIIADDASDDGSVSFIRSVYPKIKITENKHQLGFAGNVNKGVSKSAGDIVVLLNSDVVPQEFFLKPLLAVFSDPLVAAAGCLEKSHDPQGVVHRGRGVAKWEKGYFIHARGEVNKTNTLWVSGGSSAFRKKVWDELGGMDTLYNPFYWEDIDLSYRIQKAGYTICFVRESVVDHYHQEGNIQTVYSPNDIKRIVYRNQYIFHWKNISDISIALAHIVWTPYKLLQALIHGDQLMIEGFLMAILLIPGIFVHRIQQKKYWHVTDDQILTS